MPIYFLDEHLWFPPPQAAMEDGLLAVGGELNVPRLLLAYERGIFPWFNEGEPPMWWSPDPRFVLFPPWLRVSKSMAQILRGNRFEFKVNTAFEDVIRNCAAISRKDQDGTWITEAVIEAYSALHRMGKAHSAEAWEEGRLVGGLYGVRLGNVFFGESMFSSSSNASKFAFISYVRQLEREGVPLIDCQVYTEHLESLGAEMIPRDDFLALLSDHLQ